MCTPAAPPHQVIFASLVLTFAAIVASGCNAENSTEPPMDIKAFRPVKMLPQVSAYAGPGAQLLGFNARYVKSDGTMDLSADYRPLLEYEFVRPRDKATGGPVGTGAGKTHQEVTVKITKPYTARQHTRTGNTSKTFTVRYKGMQREFGSNRLAAEADEIAVAPSCDLAQVWSVAKAKGANAKAVAVIRYTPDGYDFRITDLKFRLRLSKDCQPFEEMSYTEIRAQLRKLSEEYRPGKISRESMRRKRRALINRRSLGR